MQGFDGIYLDHNATTPLKPAVREAMLSVMDLPANASAVHKAGRAARRLLETARSTVAERLGLGARDVVVFTSGATEANNLAIKGCGMERLIVSAIEHPSVLAAARASGAAVDILPVTAAGTIDLAQLEAMLTGNTRQTLVSVMLANNETGVIQPVAEVSSLARRYGALVHCDAVQAVGRIPVDISALKVDLLSLSAHKIGGPQGVGALIAANCTALSARVHGGNQEKNLRAGTENLAGITGLAAALSALDLDDMQRQMQLRDHLEKSLSEQAAPLVIFGKNSPRIGNTSLMALPGISSETQLIALDLAGICVSNGSACSSGTVTPSHVLAAMQVEEKYATGSLRVSLGWNTTETDINRFIEAWIKMYERVKDKCQN